MDGNGALVALLCNKEPVVLLARMQEMSWIAGGDKHGHEAALYAVEL